MTGASHFFGAEKVPDTVFPGKRFLTPFFATLDPLGGVW